MADITARFLALVEGEDVRLDEGAMLIAAHASAAQDVTLDVDAQVARLDDLAELCPPGLDGLRSYLFGDLGFKGNESDYSDPRNSYLNEVLDRRMGIPITLCVVAIEVGRRIGVPLAGVGLPGHFLVRHEGVPPVLLDPFNGGLSLSVEDCEALMARLYADRIVFTPSLLAPIDNRAILARMLNNLRQVFQRSGDAASAAWVLRLRAGIPGTKPRELGELATAQAALGRWEEAAGTLDRLADLLSGDEGDKARAHAGLLRSRLN
jgi:regulator of sirC expression with transglutaminase-like and TPR domain